ncbi:Abi family protein [Streptococcus parasanguinis]|uniref:Abi family protein n=1 Tax=Streptococcus parasanguinis TaxID=1318 RepID=UPI0039C0EEEA
MTREKEFKTIEEQILIQRDRNLKITDEPGMESFIQQKNYFNSINGFETIFLETSNPKKYMKRVSFKDFERIYTLDRNIAKYLFQEIEKIEVELKSRIAYEFSKVHCNSGIASNLNYLDINCYVLPIAHNRNSFTEYFYTHGNNRKTHSFFREHNISAKIKDVIFTGKISPSRNGYYNLEGDFDGIVDDLKKNQYRGRFSIKISNTPSYISSLSGSMNVTIQIKNIEGRFFELSYSDFCKIKYPYISSYKTPPLWVIIDTLMLNDLLVLFQGLDIAIQNKIMSEMGFDSSISGSREKFVNACEILRELRNQLAHFGLITRYRTGNSILINRLFISDLLLTPKRNNRVLKFYQSLKILNSFNRFSLKRIDRAIQSYYLKNMLLLKFDINKNFFNRIGK